MNLHKKFFLGTMIMSGTIFLRWNFINEGEKLNSGTACFITGIVIL